MTLTLDLPEELAFRLNALLPEEERKHFALSAIAEALSAQEKDAVACIAGVEEALQDIEAGRTFSLEEEKARWQHQKADLLTKSGVIER